MPSLTVSGSQMFHFLCFLKISGLDAIETLITRNYGVFQCLCIFPARDCMSPENRKPNILHYGMSVPGTEYMLYP